MTQDEIIRMAREAGITFEPMTIDGIEYEYRYVRCSDSIGEDEADCIERFAALVAAHERNRLAWTQEHWTQYEHAIAAAEREKLTGELINEAQLEVQRAVLAEREACAKLCYGCNKDLEEANAKYVEQAEQRSDSERMEPVAWGCKTTEDLLIFQNEKQANLFASKWELKVTPLYAAPVRTKDLTDEEIEWLVVDTLETWNSKDTMKDFARAVIAKYKEKNK